MFKPFRTVAVLSAGVMGSPIAAHLALYYVMFATAASTGFALAAVRTCQMSISNRALHPALRSRLKTLFIQ